MTKKILWIFLAGLLALPLTGCSVQRAASIDKPQYAPDLLAFGRPRSHVITQLGEPAESRKSGVSTVDTYEMTSNSKGWGIARSGTYAFLDVGTFGLWELIGTPLEDWIQQDQTVTIYYDENETIEQIKYSRN